MSPTKLLRFLVLALAVLALPGCPVSLVEPSGETEETEAPPEEEPTEEEEPAGEATGAPAVPGRINASAETDGVPSSGDAADDPAVWVHPDDPSKSVIIGTDKSGGYLIGYDLSGSELWQVADTGTPNNVDVRGNTVACSLRDADAIGVYTMDPETRTLSKRGEFDVGVDAYGLSLYVSPTTGKLFAFVSGNQSGAEQWEIALSPVSGTLVRELDVAKTEGMAADDETGKLFLAEENNGLYVYDAEPSGGQTRTEIEGIGSRLAGDVEGVTIYYAANGKGYVIVSDQGPDRYVLFARSAPHAYVGTFEIRSHPDSPVTGHDGTSETDGIHVTNLALGNRFPQGLFVAQDGSNSKPSDTQNFKLVPWERIADMLDLDTDITFTPGG